MSVCHSFISRHEPGGVTMTAAVLVRSNAPVLLFTAIVGAPARLVRTSPDWKASKIDFVEVLKAKVQSTNKGPGRVGGQGVNVAEVSLSLVLLAGAGPLWRERGTSLHHSDRVDPETTVRTMTISLPTKTYGQIWSGWSEYMTYFQRFWMCSPHPGRTDNSGFFKASFRPFKASTSLEVEGRQPSTPGNRSSRFRRNINLRLICPPRKFHC